MAGLGASLGVRAGVVTRLPGWVHMACYVRANQRPRRARPGLGDGHGLGGL